ncbi:hypothetical protein HZC34_00785 [Candidatus Saganbacteria bacterium]|nr:hypothetical protein [Candidatus Saganbacteria bacterium]
MALMCGLTEDCKNNRPGAPCIHEWGMMIMVAVVAIYLIGKAQGWF